MSVKRRKKKLERCSILLEITWPAALVHQNVLYSPLPNVIVPLRINYHTIIMTVDRPVSTKGSFFDVQGPSRSEEGMVQRRAGWVACPVSRNRSLFSCVHPPSPVWTDLGLKSGVSVCKLISTLKKKKKSTGGEWIVEYAPQNPCRWGKGHHNHHHINCEVLKTQDLGLKGFKFWGQVLWSPLLLSPLCN